MVYLTLYIAFSLQACAFAAVSVSAAAIRHADHKYSRTDGPTHLDRDISLRLCRGFFVLLVARLAYFEAVV